MFFPRDRCAEGVSLCLICHQNEKTWFCKTTFVGVVALEGIHFFISAGNLVPFEKVIFVLKNSRAIKNQL